jgi:hypothetical protein
MFSDDEYVFAPQPFWFASSELSADLMRAELNTIHQLLAEHADFRKLLDSPEATSAERKACFALLAHRKLFQLIDEQRVSMYDDPFSLDERELHALSRTSNLVAGDEPGWVREMNEVVERLPPRILAALPEPLHSQSFNTGNPEQDEASRSAAMTLSTVERIQALTERVIDEQWRRFAGRWPTPVVSQAPPMQSNGKTLQPNKKKSPRKRDKQRIARYQEIAEIADISETNIEFLQTMDERKVKPQPTWSGWPGSWVQAYKNERLRKLIHQDKSRAISRARQRKK